MSDKPALSSLKKQVGGEATEAALQLLLINTSQSVNVGKNLNEFQVRICCKKILETYYYLNIDEIEQCMMNGLTGKYGPLYDRLDITVIFEWLDKYDQERLDACELVRNADDSEHNIYDIVKSDSVSDVLKKLREKDHPRHRHGIKKMTSEEWNAMLDRKFTAWVEGHWRRIRYGMALSEHVDEDGIPRILIRKNSYTYVEFAALKSNQFVAAYKTHKYLCEFIIGMRKSLYPATKKPERKLAIENFYKWCEQRFDALYMKQGVDVKNVRYVMAYGKQLTYMEFMQRKHEQMMRVSNKENQ